MKNSGLIWWIGAFVLAALAGILTYGLLSSSVPASAAGKENTNTVAVIVADENIPFRRSIREEDLTTRYLPVDSVPTGVAITLDQVVGKMSTVDLFANEPILTQQLVTPDVVTQQVALSVPDGKIVMAVPTQSKLISNRLIRPGDFIDMMATFDVEVQSGGSKSPQPKTVSVLKSLEIHAIILPGTTVEEGPQGVTQQEGGVFRTADEGGQSVLLAIDLQDAMTIRHILDVGGVLDLALRPAGDESMADTEVVDEFYLADRFNIDLNRD
ncbi:MAG: Flp pilus assembly protein CpaB [Caldilineaceae bacterium]|nr:Flp pilus assembly protein CpaB [Caldilineaceae bacterium]